MPFRITPQTREELAEYLGAGATAFTLWSFNWPAGGKIEDLQKTGADITTPLLIGAGAAALGTVGATMLRGWQSSVASGVGSGAVAYLAIVASQVLGKGFQKPAAAAQVRYSAANAYRGPLNRIAAPTNVARFTASPRSALEI